MSKLTEHELDLLVTYSVVIDEIERHEAQDEVVSLCVQKILKDIGYSESEASKGSLEIKPTLSIFREEFYKDERVPTKMKALNIIVGTAIMLIEKGNSSETNKTNIKNRPQKTDDASTQSGDSK